MNLSQHKRLILDKVEIELYKMTESEDIISDIRRL
jgi:hypothetical protein